MTIILSAVI